MCFGCTLSFGDMSSPDWMRWDDHPVRQDYNVIMDLGEGAFSQVSLACWRYPSPCMSPAMCSPIDLAETNNNHPVLLKPILAAPIQRFGLALHCW